ncbi:hypothetical protein C7974DRAFT_403523 [Boeremia exigua]|uniref:uncharacterized protein n=1 Tax=Boeremia exigua TaxID=749465 RepID=UPI001E8E2464|nr:uncharacterized protein C7974DRAFT_403523 [Boeremia exigua]KAH6615228.1 hypothetical protein C7974DRAFT_403523 [Boeremia exigua]
MPAQMTSPLRRRLERIYPGQNDSINTYRVLSHSNENKVDEYDEIYEPEARPDHTAPRQALRERPQSLVNLPRCGRPLGEIISGSSTAAGQNTRRSVRVAARATKSTPAQLLHQAGAVSSPTVPKAAQHGSLLNPLDHVEEEKEEEDLPLDPQDVTIFEDEPYAEEQNDEEENESGLGTGEQQVSRGHESQTRKPRKSNRPCEPDTFACLHQGSTSIPLVESHLNCRQQSILWSFLACSLVCCRVVYFTSSVQTSPFLLQHESLPASQHLDPFLIEV